MPPVPTAAAQAVARPRVVCTQGKRSDGSHADFPHKVKKALGMRKDLEARRVKQLWSIAKALDDVAREEVHSLRTTPAAGAQTGADHGVHHEDIDVDFDAVFASIDVDDETGK
jgi:hypothetical protein